MGTFDVDLAYARGPGGLFALASGGLSVEIEGGDLRATPRTYDLSRIRSAVKTMLANISRGDWQAELTRFTERNAGRRTSLEMHDPAIGVQEQQRDYQLQGLAFDHRDNRIEIMLGGFQGAGPHLTHTIGNVGSLGLVTDAEGRDAALRVEHDGVHTLLRIRRDA